MAQIDWWIYQVVGKVFLAALARWSTLLKVTVSKQIRFVSIVMRKNQLEATALTGKIEGKRARGRQRKPAVHGLDIYCMWRLMERQQRNVNNVISICWSPTSESDTNQEKYVDVCMFRHNTTTWQTDRQTDRLYQYADVPYLFPHSICLWDHRTVSCWELLSVFDQLWLWSSESQQLPNASVCWNNAYRRIFFITAAGSRLRTCSIIMVDIYNENLRFFVHCVIWTI